MNIGLIAHDAKKKLMQNFCIAYRGILSKHNLSATGTTGRLVEEVTTLNKVMRLCDTHNIPLATNLATAELLIMALDRGDFEFREAYR